MDAARWKAVKFGQIKCSQLAMPNLPKRDNIAEGIMRACVQYRACIHAHACIVKTATQVWTWDLWLLRPLALNRETSGRHQTNIAKYQSGYWVASSGGDLQKGSSKIWAPCGSKYRTVAEAVF